MVKRTFTVGDLVQLKSGGPTMTVNKIDYDENGCYCSWFAGAKLNTGHFEFEALEPAEKQSEHQKAK